MPTCLVTGGAGFLGSHLSDELLRRGQRVICVDNLETGSLANIEHIRSPDYEFRNVDIISPYEVEEPIDFVYHLASPASPIGYVKHMIVTLKTNSAGTWNLLEMAEAKSSRFLMASTSESYGDPHINPQREDYWGNVNPIGLRSMYDEASGSVKPARWLTTASVSSTRESSASSTPTVRAWIRTTAAS